MRRAVLTLALFACAACSQTVAAVHPVSADYARNDVPSEMQPDVETVLAAKEDTASREALRCILAVAYMTEQKQIELERHAYPSALEVRKAPDSARRREPPMPDGGNVRAPRVHCEEATKSADPRIAKIGRTYGERAVGLGFDAVQAEVHAKDVEGIELLLARGDTNGAYRKVVRLRGSGLAPALTTKLDTIEAQNRDAFATEAAFEAMPEVRILRRRLAALEDQSRRLEARGASTPNALVGERNDVAALLAEKHDAFVRDRR